MRLCGIGIPHENQFTEQTAANRIHQEAQDIEINPLAYDGPDMFGALEMVIEGAQGILRAVARGNPMDFSGNPLDAITVKNELNELSEDLQKIERLVSEKLKTQSGRNRWGIDFVGSINERIKEAHNLSEKMKLKALIS